MTLTDRLDSLSRAIERNREILDSGVFFRNKLAEIIAARIIITAIRADKESRLLERRIARHNHVRNA